MSFAELADTTLATVRLWLDRSISAVLDLTTHRGLIESELLRRLPWFALLVSVHCSASNAKQRCRARLEAQGAITAEALDELFERYDAEPHRTVPPPELECPRLEVDTTDGYEPSLEQLIDDIL